ncbi:hypothetical protein DKM19_06280 [Streptosporangium sp. 'caverna']|nr:hypothetical protein DKM19_06280 [Streptosporangium sp. 'caverna']
MNVDCLWAYVGVCHYFVVIMMDRLSGGAACRRDFVMRTVSRLPLSAGPAFEGFVAAASEISEP